MNFQICIHLHYTPLINKSVNSTWPSVKKLHLVLRNGTFYQIPLQTQEIKRLILVIPQENGKSHWHVLLSL